MPLHPTLKDILKPAYRCVGFDGTCSPPMRWAPHLGHVPRGFYGATGNLENVVLVLVLAEPGDPSPNPGPEECYADVDSAFAFTGHCYLNAGRQGHENVRKLIRRCFPGLSLVDAMRKVWITESVLCSAETSGGSVAAGCETLCASKYLEPQLRLFPNAIVAAMGTKASKRLKRIKKRIPNIVVECFSVFVRGPHIKKAEETWDNLAPIVRAKEIPAQLG